MKVAILSHSAVAKRQQIFYEELSKQVEILVLSPERWFSHYAPSYVKENYDFRSFLVENEGDMHRYQFPPEAFKVVEEFSPDIIYVQNEAYSRMTREAKLWAKRLGCKFCYFIWENIHKAQPLEADLIVAGNSEAAEMYGADLVLPQVGICTETFAPRNVEKTHELVFVGRKVPEKGLYVLRRAIKDLNVRVLFSGGQSYLEMPDLYNKALIHVSPSIDTPFWKEQFGPFSNVEAIACGLRVITSNSKAIVEWIGKCPGVTIIPQKDDRCLREAIVNELQKGWQLNQAGRQYVKERFSKEVVALELMEAFRKVA